VSLSRSTITGLAFGLFTLTTGSAFASTALEYPDNGVAQFSRAGAWLATATDPIAGYYNPAALATQPTSFSVGLNLAFQKICYQRVGPDGKAQGASTIHTAQGATYPEVCNPNSGQPNAIPSLALTWRASERLAVGFTVVPPSAYGLLEWPDVVRTKTTSGIETSEPAPQRYLSLYTKGTILFPTLSAGYSVTDRLHVGVGFVAGIAILELRSMSIGTVSATAEQNDPGQDDFDTDSRSTIKAKDLFVPGAVASVLYEATSNFDIAGWYRWSDSIKAKGDLEVVAPYYDGAGTPRPEGDVVKSKDQVGKDAASIELTIPMEARIGARWHVPRPAPATTFEREQLRSDSHRTRDPLRDDLYDVELDLTWAKNSDGDVTKIRFADGIFVAGLGSVPTNADRPTGWKDSFGARLGGQVNVARNLAGLRAGTWVETSAVDDAHLSVTGVPALRGGFGGGFVLRIQSVDVEAGYQHIWNAGLDNGGDGKLKAIASTGSPDHRSYHAVNGGKISQHANVIALGAVTRF